jgi:uncharacterized protein (TIGR03435 family)
MMWTRLIHAVLLAGAATAFAASPEFEVAAIKPVVIGSAGIAPGPVRPMLQYSANGLSARQTLRALIAEAYQVVPSRVTEPGEDFKNILDRLYDLTAKSEQPASREDLRLMLRSLLTQRFQLSLHPEQKPEDVYRLVVRKGGAKIERSDATEENAHWQRRPEGVWYRDSSPRKFAEMLSVYMQRKVLPPPELQGLYNFPFSEKSAMNDEGRDAIVDGLQQAGMDLVKGKAVLDYLVVDHAAPVSEN